MRPKFCDAKLGPSGKLHRDLKMTGAKILMILDELVIIRRFWTITMWCTLQGTHCCRLIRSGDSSDQLPYAICVENPLKTAPTSCLTVGHQTG
ncbi:hypothetical protein PoB_005604100 [Plakobranchus ocellatus]|uniref:Uncharacterized protein n=1 Tax=Plakobranchus ocellatus TaxID=259542 RepID=A0AAV4CDX2_9GAST|nr:hypothetical protein PoB_005604100 [Plakobranchus ocellatus]